MANKAKNNEITWILRPLTREEQAEDLVVGNEAGEGAEDRRQPAGGEDVAVGGVEDPVDDVDDPVAPALVEVRDDAASRHPALRRPGIRGLRLLGKVVEINLELYI